MNTSFVLSVEGLIAVLFVVATAVLAVGLRKLTPVAGISGAVLGILLFAAFGWTGIGLMGAFFVLGTGATAWQKRKKLALGIEPENSMGRNAGQVLANGGAAGLLALLALIAPGQSGLFLILSAAAFSSATADTLSSELGSAYGRKFFDILTFKKGRRGDDGVISLEGLLFGLAGSAVIGGIYLLTESNTVTFLSILLAGTIGNLSDSVLGATLERRHSIGNDAVNFFNTVVAVLTMLLLVKI